MTGTGLRISMKRNPNSLQKGQLLNGYRIDKTIGGGGFSLV